MTDTVKLIIEIPKDYYEIIKHEVEHHLTDYRPFEIIANGTPLDDIKKEIFKLIDNTDSIYGTSALHSVLDILDNIGKAESEE